MTNEGCTPSPITYKFLLQANALAGQLNNVARLHAGVFMTVDEGVHFLGQALYFVCGRVCIYTCSILRERVRIHACTIIYKMHLLPMCVFAGMKRVGIVPDVPVLKMLLDTYGIQRNTAAV